MPNRVSGKMQKALHKLQKSISSSHLNYQAMHHHSDAKSPSRTGGTLRNGCAFGRSGRFAVSGLNYSDSDSDDSAPIDVPEGNLVVYVGEERRRFVVQAKHLSHPVFKALLNKSAEEFGYEHKGGLEIACEVDFFKHMLCLIETNDSSFSSTEIDELVGIYAYPQCVDA